MILDATSGNTGIAYTMIGRPMAIAPRSASQEASEERKGPSKPFGAKLVPPPGAGSDGAILHAGDLPLRIHPVTTIGSVTDNPATGMAHFETTGPGSSARASRRADALSVAALGTAAPSPA